MNQRLQITLPYTKPCHGTAVVELPVEKEEIDKVKAIAIKKIGYKVNIIQYYFANLFKILDILR